MRRLQLQQLLVGLASRHAFSRIHPQQRPDHGRNLRTAAFLTQLAVGRWGELALIRDTERLLAREQRVKHHTKGPRIRGGVVQKLAAARLLCHDFGRQEILCATARHRGVEGHPEARGRGWLGELEGVQRLAKVGDLEAQRAHIQSLIARHLDALPAAIEQVVGLEVSVHHPVRPQVGHRAAELRSDGEELSRAEERRQLCGSVAVGEQRLEAAVHPLHQHAQRSLSGEFRVNVPRRTERALARPIGEV